MHLFHMGIHRLEEINPLWLLRLSVLMDLYIHHLYVLVINILFSIPKSPALIYPLSTVGSTYHFI
jgi:hypothetical protein